jgi:hypothetical protein
MNVLIAENLAKAAASMEWHPWSDQDEPSDADGGRCFLLFIDWCAINPALVGMGPPHVVIGMWRAGCWMSQADEDDSWSGPVKAVTHWARL